MKFFKTFLFLSSLLMSARVFANNQENSSEQPNSAIIHLVIKDEQFKFDEATSKHWLTICDKLGKALSIKSGPFGMGVFSHYDCQNLSKPQSLSQNSLEWKLAVAESKSAMTFELSRSGSTLAKVNITRSKRFFEIFEDPLLIDLVACEILDQLPYAGAIESGGFDKRHSISGRSLNGAGSDTPILSPYEAISFFELKLRPGSKLFSASFVRSGKLVKQSTNENSVAWQLESTASLKAAPPKYILWHSKNGPGGYTKEIHLAVEARISELEKAAVGDDSNGCVATRIGHQLFKNSPLVAKTWLIGVLAEFRGGPVSGLRLYYDLVPRATYSDEQGDQSIRWQRFIFAKAFDLKLNWGFVDSINFVPKIGIWTLDATLPLETNGVRVRNQKFSTKNGVTIGIETGMEKNISSSVLARGWYAYDLAPSMLHKNDRLSSQRLGLDLFWRVGNNFTIAQKQFKTAILAFYTYDLTTITRENDEDFDGPVSSKIEGGYLGTGVGISW